MPSIHSLLKQLKNDYPELTFSASDSFRWSPSSRTLYFDEAAPDGAIFLLHELGHALLDHQEYSRDIDLIKIERDAWSYAVNNFSAPFGVPISDETVQDNLDTYRDWLHARSTCPHCQATGLQIAKQLYRCVGCSHEWRVNEARNCQLRRYTLAH